MARDPMSPFSPDVDGIEPAPQPTSIFVDGPQAADKAPVDNSTVKEIAEQLAKEESEAEETTPKTTSSTPKAPEKPAAQAAIKKALRELKLKVDGKEYSEKLPFDLPDDPAAIEYMQKQLQLSKMGQSRAQQTAELQKEVLSFFDKLRTDPKAALADPMVGVDVKKLAQQIIEEEIENSKKSPEQIEKEKLQAEIKELRAKQEADKKDWEQKETTRLQELAYDQYESEMVKALEGSDLPKSPYVVKKMAEYMLLGLQEGKDLRPEDVLPLVRDEIQGDIKDMFAAMPDEVVEKLIGKDKLDGIRKKKIAKAKTPPPQPVSKQLQDVASPKKEVKPGKPQTYKQFFKM